jgi:hypothetical protein
MAIGQTEWFCDPISCHLRHSLDAFDAPTSGGGLGSAISD